MVGKSPSPDFWRNKRVLVTGHTGFKGSWLCLWLSEMGAKVSGVALAPDPLRSHYDIARIEQRMDSRLVDIRDHGATVAAIVDLKPEFVFHLAAQPLVNRSLAEPAETFATNVSGTSHVLDGALRAEAAGVLAVTSDKVYRNEGHGKAFVEDDTLGGKDPYSSSKAMCELLAASYRDCYFRDQGKALATARAGNVIGGGDFGADRIIPDCIRAAEIGKPVILRSPEATRPWQHVLDCLNGYLLFAELMMTGEAPTTLNFGPRHDDAVTVRDVAHAMDRAISGAGVVEKADKASKEAAHLAVDASLAESVLGWRTIRARYKAIDAAAAWYQDWFEGNPGPEISLNDLKNFIEAAKSSD